MKYGIAVRIVETGYVEIEAECKAEAKAIDEMWEYIQAFGTRTDYSDFSKAIWTKKNFKPVYDFIVYRYAEADIFIQFIF